jgi:pimeloyl-ACP methyl ester carboxylesterase
LLQLSRQRAATKTVHVYLEGDGPDWLSPYHPPPDPTPRRPVALQLAEADPAEQVIYLGRPCQYLSATALANCSPDYWLARRFAPEVIAAYDELVTALRRQHAAANVVLIGYSGGGVIAALLAARRADIAALVTIAAPLALTEWLSSNGFTPLTGSLDPSASSPITRWPKGIHLAGGRDEVVRPRVVEAFARQTGGRFRLLQGADHDCCWRTHWPDLLGELKKEMVQ